MTDADLAFRYSFWVGIVLCIKPLFYILSKKFITDHKREILKFSFFVSILHTYSSTYAIDVYRKKTFLHFVLFINI
jgi:hypothetical protein